MEDGADFDSLTNLYRKIFRFLLDFTPTEKTTNINDRTSEREIAAALESVFPRLGLKMFVQLSIDEKCSQLMELARIVLGIRLFNRAQGRGGAGIDNIDEICPILASEIENEISKEVIAFTNLCNKYQSTIVKGLLYKKKNDLINTQKSEYSDFKHHEHQHQQSSNEIHVTDYLLDRWSNELSNRRQYLAFLRSLQDEINTSINKIKDILDTITSEILNLKSMVSGKSAVPKEQVYPKFDLLASTWLSLWEEYHLLKSRNNTYINLKQFRNSFIPLLTEKIYAIIGGITTNSTVLNSINDDVIDADYKDYNNLYDDSKDDLNKGSVMNSIVEAIISNENSDYKNDSKYDNENNYKSHKDTYDDFNDDKSVPGNDNNTMKADSKESIRNDSILSTNSGAVLLTVANTPGFMLLPLELQGFCPWTIVKANGLLIPGKPALGVIKYENLYYVCEHAEAIRAFISDPMYYLDRIKTRACKNPEFIHLLRLQHYFPTASIAKLVQRPEFDAVSNTSVMKKDASTDTPIHFIEKHIDPNYEWNEWKLRQKVLQITNLKNCITVSQQTDNSHFRRDNETQVYTQRVKETQTKRDNGTNPKITTTYITGLRGKSANDSTSISKYIKNDGGNESNLKNKGRVVTLTLEL
jgi:hypothetical protein